MEQKPLGDTQLFRLEYCSPTRAEYLGSEPHGRQASAPSYNNRVNWTFTMLLVCAFRI